MKVRFYIETVPWGNGAPLESDQWEQVGWQYAVKRYRYPAQVSPWVKTYETEEAALKAVTQMIEHDREEGLRAALFTY